MQDQKNAPWNETWRENMNERKRQIAIIRRNHPFLQRKPEQEPGELHRAS